MIFYQVSQLVILHEDAEGGLAMPDLSAQVQAVSAAVQNLVLVRMDICFHNLYQYHGQLKHFQPINVLFYLKD